MMQNKNIEYNQQNNIKNKKKKEANDLQRIKKSVI